MDERYEILNVSVRKLMDLHGYLGASLNEPLKLSKKDFFSAILKVSVHGTNALFYQLKQLVYEKHSFTHDSLDQNEKIFHDVLLYFDFKRIFDEKNLKRLSRFDVICRDLFIHGIQIELSDGNYYTFKPFIKSGSMSRNSVISFIRDDYYSSLYNRLNFELFKEGDSYVLSKVFAYQGLYLSSGKRIPLSDLDEKSVVVIKDINLEQNTKKYSTALSKKMFDGFIEKMFYTEDENEYLDLLDYIDYLAKSKNHPKYQVFSSDVEESAHYFMYTLPLVREACVKRIYEAKRKNVNPKSIKLGLVDRLIDDFHHQYLIYLGFDKTHNEEELVFFDGISRDLPINMFDGEGVIDLSLIEEINQKYLNIAKPPYYHSIQFRLPFTKGVLHSVNLKQWFDEYNVDYIVDCYDMKRSVKNIKVILTESQFKAKKWLKSLFYDPLTKEYTRDPMNYYFELFKRYDHALYIVNTDSLYETGMTTLNYQVLHTPNLFLSEFKSLLECGNQTIINLATSYEAQIEYFSNQSRKPIDRTSIDYQFSEEHEDIMVQILKKNPAFIKQSIYQNRIRSKLDAMIRDMKIGSLPIRGTVRYLSGDLYDLMYRMTNGVRIPKEMSLNHDFYAPGLTDVLDSRKYYSLLRNPHITSKELVSTKPISMYSSEPKSIVIGEIKNQLITENGIENKVSISQRWSEREKYFSHLKGAVMIDSYSNFMAAMQTADTDGDVVRLIFDEVYNEAVRRSVVMNQNRILFFPSYEPQKQVLNSENFYNVVKRTFTSRIGIMSNDAFSKSIHAYNANSDNDLFKDKMRKQTELLSLIVSAELDAPKSGIAPYYVKGYTKNKFIDYKNKVEAKQKENIFFEKLPDSPNLNFLKDNAETLIKIKKTTRKNNEYKNINLFEFQRDESWRKNLDKNLKNEIENLIMAFKDWDKQLGFITHMSPTKQSKAYSTISHIISLQYDDTINMSFIENIIDKLLVMDIDDLIEIQDQSIKEKWHLSLDFNRDYLLESLLPKILDFDEKELLMNFDQSGHKLLFLILSEVINRINSNNLADLSSLDTISRYRLIIEQAYNRHNIDGSKEIFYITNKILTGKYKSDELIKDHVTNYLTEETYDQEKLSGYIETYFNKLSSYHKGKAKINEQNLSSISRHFRNMSSFIKHQSGALRRTSSIRKDVYNYCLKELRKMFKLYGVDFNEVIKYLYASSKFDPSMKFMFEILPEQFLDHVALYDKEVIINAE